MNEEEAIKQLKQWLSVIDFKKKSNIIPNKDDIQAIETVLNLLEKKDKMIDEKAEIIGNVYKGTLEYNRELALATTKEVKQYFERKVEG